MGGVGVFCVKEKDNLDKSDLKTVVVLEIASVRGNQFFYCSNFQKFMRSFHGHVKNFENLYGTAAKFSRITFYRNSKLRAVDQSFLTLEKSLTFGIFNFPPGKILNYLSKKS